MFLARELPFCGCPWFGLRRMGGHEAARANAGSAKESAGFTLLHAARLRAKGHVVQARIRTKNSRLVSLTGVLRARGHARVQKGRAAAGNRLAAHNIGGVQMPNKLDHVAFNVPDVRKAAQDFSDVFGIGSVLVFNEPLGPSTSE